MNDPKSEIGRELNTAELKPRTIVVLNAEHRPDVFVTMWVERVDAEMVWLLGAAAVPVIHLGLFRQADGTLKDDGGRTVRVLEYLGEP